MKNKSISCITEIKRRHCEYNDNPNRSGQVNNSITLCFTLHAIDYFKFYSIFGCFFQNGLLVVPILVCISADLSFIRLEFDKFFVPGVTLWIDYLHTDHREEVITVNVIIPCANILKSLLNSVLISEPAFLIVVLLYHKGH